MEVDQGEFGKREKSLPKIAKRSKKKYNTLNDSIKLHHIFKEVMVRHSLKNLVNAH